MRRRLNASGFQREAVPSAARVEPLSATTTDTRQREELRAEVRKAAGDFFRRRLVVGRRAAHRRGDEGVAQREPVADVLRRGNVGEARLAQGRHEEVARSADAVAGEHAARTVRAVRSRRQADDEQARARSPNPGTASPNACRRGTRGVFRSRCAGNAHAAAGTARRTRSPGHVGQLRHVRGVGECTNLRRGLRGVASQTRQFGARRQQHDKMEELAQRALLAFSIGGYNTY
jgi:hypothetical protein